MPLIFVSSTGDHAGQTLFTWAVARRLMEKGFNVGFLKPFGTHPVQTEALSTDRDAVLFKEILNLEEPLNRLCPYPITDASRTQSSPAEMILELRALVQELSTGRDVLLIMGSGEIFFDVASHGIPETSLITALDADLLLLNRFRDVSTSVYSILSVCSLLGDRVKGIILNRVPPERFAAGAGQLVPRLAEKGIRIAVVLPEDPILSCRSLREVLEILDGEIIWGEEKLDNPVSGMTVGSADLEGELLILKRVYNKIVLLQPSTKTEEPPISRPIAGVILTGGRRPPSQVIEAVKRADIPLMIVERDTFATRELLEANPPSISPRDEAKIRRLTELMDRDDAFDRLLHSLGVTAN